MLTLSINNRQSNTHTHTRQQLSKLKNACKFLGNLSKSHQDNKLNYLVVTAIATTIAIDVELEATHRWLAGSNDSGGVKVVVGSGTAGRSRQSIAPQQPTRVGNLGFDFVIEQVQPWSKR